RTTTRSTDKYAKGLADRGLLEGEVRAAVDVQGGAGGELRRLRTEEGDDLAEVSGLAHAHRLLRLRAAVELLDARRAMEAGLDAVDRHTVTSDFERQRLQERRRASAGGVREDQMGDRLAHRHR